MKRIALPLLAVLAAACATPKPPVADKQTDEQREPKVRRASLEFPLTGHKDLVAEGIAYDGVDDVFYVSSIYRRKVLRVTPDGQATDFVAEGQDGMLGGLGMTIDLARRLLWVISTTTKEMRGHVPGVDQSMLAAYDLRDGKLVRRLDVAPAMLNDLTLLDDGTIFATDMGRHKVMRLAPGADALEEFADGFLYPNGITNDGTTLYVADFRGLHRIVLAGKTRTNI